MTTMTRNSPTRANGNGHSAPPAVAPVRCAIYTRKSTDEGLDQEFNSLDAQREAAEAYINSQRHEGWMALPDRYDDGGYSGGTRWVGPHGPLNLQRGGFGPNPGTHGGHVGGHGR